MSLHCHRKIQDLTLSASACAIGMFDGMHVGHHMVLEHALREARANNVESVVFSFANHPQFLISSTPTQLLSSLDERLLFFEQLGFDHALILDFDEWLKNLTAESFIQDILRKTLGAVSVTVGYDHRFGKGRQGDGAYLTQMGRQYGFSTHIIDPVRVNEQIVSSTLIRKLISFGDLSQANQLLGREYTLSGMVVHGVQRGRALGFPTANLEIEAHRLIPTSGTYAVLAVLEDGELYPAVCNIGYAPTFADQHVSRVEVHLLGYAGEPLYGKTMTIAFYQKLREEQAFPSVDELVQQIKRDCKTAETALSGATFDSAHAVSAGS